MIDLKDALNDLNEFHELRNRARELREQGRRALTDIVDTSIEGRVSLRDEDADLRDRWIASGNSVEVALLVKVLNHQDMGEDEKENDEANATEELKNRLRKIRLKNLFPSTNYHTKVRADEKGDRRVPVLVAARSMQALLSRSETVFSRATLLCYYRIVRELYIAARPDWTIGAARAGTDGTTSAFVTGECIRAIFAFEDVMKRTATFCKSTRRLLGRYQLLQSMSTVLHPQQTRTTAFASVAGSDDHKAQKGNPAEMWADRAIERMWFDWYISTNPRNKHVALYSQGADGNRLYFNPTQRADMAAVGVYVNSLQENLIESVKLALKNIIAARDEIKRYRLDQSKFFREEVEKGNVVRKPNGDQSDFEKRLRDYDRAESAHKFAFALIGKAAMEAKTALDCLNNQQLPEVLDALNLQFTRMAEDIHRVLEPAKRYIRTVLNREVASTAFGRIDAGELVFAAASYGAITDWKPSELLTRACALLIEALPENGRLPTTRPFHSTLKGHRMLPIGCEMTRSLAQLLQKTNYDIEPKLVRRMLNIFEEKLISLDTPGRETTGKRVAWNFDGSPDPNNPCVWVTAVSVLAIDRIVRMLNERINSVIFRYFEVIKPEKPHRSLTLNDLVYPDYGLCEYHERQPQRPMALQLEQMRAHVMRVTSPKLYKDARGQKEILTSAIFYGPPGTGKTTLVEALALSAERPLIRLSPSDLVVQGPAAIEGRARNVFDALCMLTQVVIILDEFEDVVGQRGEANVQHGEAKIFEFLRTGMLPKLVKLNDAARKQSFVYCLATNYLKKIDTAAQRKGRFDLRLPVYDPDPVSRAGTLLYRCYRVVEKLGDGASGIIERESLTERFLEVIEKTRGTRASSFANDYLELPSWVIKKGIDPPPGYEADIPVYWFILTGQDVGYDEKIEGAIAEGAQTQTARGDFEKNDATDEEKKQGRWLDRYEAQLVDTLRKSPLTLDDLWTCLTGPADEEQMVSGKRSFYQVYFR